MNRVVPEEQIVTTEETRQAIAAAQQFARDAEHAFRHVRDSLIAAFAALAPLRLILGPPARRRPASPLLAAHRRRRHR